MKCLTLLLTLLALASSASKAADYVTLPGGEFRSALPEPGATKVRVAPFQLRVLPVTNAEFLTFVQAHPEWQRGRVAALFAGPHYLNDWRSPLDHRPLMARAPVTNISWHAADAFCRSENARLPSWREWEFAAAADATRADARDDPAWREKILAWYEHPNKDVLPEVGRDAANIYGLHDVHSSIFEWVEDFNGLFVASDSRSQGEENNLATCGAGALSLEDRDNYAILMRIALLTSLQASDTVSSLGFRCARDAATDTNMPSSGPQEKQP